jgi:hypothetical protein
MARVSIQILSTADIDEAYVLARLGDAGLTLKAWRAKVVLRNASPDAGGVLLARDLEARPCGLVVYALTDQPDGRRSLQVETLIGCHVLDPQRVASALITEVVRLARAVGCETLCLMRPLGQSVEVAAQVLATGVAVLPSLFWSSPPVDRPTRPFDLGQGRRPSGRMN